MPEKWFCKKCGSCCETQYTRMHIFHTEIYLFPKGTYFKYAGYGDSISEIKPLFYKLINKKCPLYDANIGCTVYEDRPVLCRVFPICFPQIMYGEGPPMSLDESCTNSPTKDTPKFLTAEYKNSLKNTFTELCKQQDEMAMRGKTTTLWIYQNFQWRAIPNEAVQSLL